MAPYRSPTPSPLDAAIRNAALVESQADSHFISFGGDWPLPPTRSAPLLAGGALQTADGCL